MNSDCVSITVLIDNQVLDGLQAEHGLSFFIETTAGNIIFDAGQGGVLSDNAEFLNIDLLQSEFLVLSHGHYDHSGGVGDLLNLNPALKLFMHPDAMQKRYSCHHDCPVKDISMPEEVCRKIVGHPLVIPVTGPREIVPGIWLSGEIPRKTDFEDVGGPFFLDPESHTADPIIDDLSLYIETASGLVVVPGCCHSGIVNTVKYIREISGIEKVKGIIGGMHLLHASEARLTRTCEEIAEWNPDFVIPCHCSGDGAVKAMRERLREVVQQGYAGLVIRIPLR